MFFEHKFIRSDSPLITMLEWLGCDVEKIPGEKWRVHYPPSDPMQLINKCISKCLRGMLKSDAALEIVADNGSYGQPVFDFLKTEGKRKVGEWVIRSMLGKEVTFSDDDIVKYLFVRRQISAPDQFQCASDAALSAQSLVNRSSFTAAGAVEAGKSAAKAALEARLVQSMPDRDGHVMLRSVVKVGQQPPAEKVAEARAIVEDYQGRFSDLTNDGDNRRAKLVFDFYRVVTGDKQFLKMVDGSVTVDVSDFLRALQLTVAPGVKRYLDRQQEELGTESAATGLAPSFAQGQ